MYVAYSFRFHVFLFITCVKNNLKKALVGTNILYEKHTNPWYQSDGTPTTYCHASSIFICHMCKTYNMKKALVGTNILYEMHTNPRYQTDGTPTTCCHVV